MKYLAIIAIVIYVTGYAVSKIDLSIAATDSAVHAHNVVLESY